MVGHFDCKPSCLIEKNVRVAFILPSRWHDGAESLGIETNRCLCFCHLRSRVLPRMPNRFDIEDNPDAPEAPDLLEEENEYDRKRRDVDNHTQVDLFYLANGVL